MAFTFTGVCMNCGEFIVTSGGPNSAWLGHEYGEQAVKEGISGKLQAVNIDVVLC